MQTVGAGFLKLPLSFDKSEALLLAEFIHLGLVAFVLASQKHDVLRKLFL